MTETDQLKAMAQAISTATPYLIAMAHQLGKELGDTRATTLIVQFLKDCEQSATHAATSAIQAEILEKELSTTARQITPSNPFLGPTPSKQRYKERRKKQSDIISENKSDNPT